MQNWNIKIIAEKSHKNWIWEGLGLDLGVVWDGLELLLDALGSFFAVSLAFKIELFSNMDPRWAPKGLLDGFGIDFGESGEGFGRFWANFWMDFGKIWGILAPLGMSLGGFLGTFSFLGPPR